ncbi:MAG: FAD-dependent oxidoreductase [Gemmatimonadota bacterium]
MSESPPAALLPREVDVVIVGAGVAGLYCAWRILTYYPEKRVLVVDRLNRTGGRLQSDLIDYGGGEVREEEGGMRFVSAHDLLLRTFAALDKCPDIVTFPMQDPSGHNRRAYRGRSFTVKGSEADHNAIWGELYNLAPDGSEPRERGVEPAEIISDVYTRVLRENGHDEPPANPTPDFWQRLRLDFTWKGTSLKDWQFWGLLTDMGYSNECVVMLTQTIGFEGPIVDMANAGVALQLLMDFPADPAFYTARAGFAAIPDALADRVEKAGGRIALDTELTAIAQKSDGSYELAFAPEWTDRTRAGLGVPTTQVHTPEAILAIPSGPLMDLYPNSPALHAVKDTQALLERLRSVVGLPLLKVNLYYERPWWENGSLGIPPFTAGPSFTDLAINAVYPFGSIEGDPIDGPAALTIYCDYAKINLWRGLQGIPPMFDSEIQRAHSHKPQTIFPASQAVVREVTAQLKLLFDVDALPEPVMTSYQLWTDELETGAAYHQWALGADDRDVIANLIEPLPGLYTAGEAYSDMQGWVEGALRSAELVLSRMEIPSLLDEDIDPCPLPMQPLWPSSD